MRTLASVGKLGSGIAIKQKTQLGLGLYLRVYLANDFVLVEHSSKMWVF